MRTAMGHIYYHCFPRGRKEVKEKRVKWKKKKKKKTFKTKPYML